ncbi:hypothetical protein GCK72_001939 [Caenorhabditis remanei]|uniref:BTB domain-containing protein n=1 Tax=Caenorhabditis remanei TaxID=31234 RepID=E3LML5_CAERE|nr:hypothetical protein GCK72_001939 [Caenorhabditis remanei]EFP02728.1 hypothetical protein CRE_28468 [Caenorhabditis remanei]KAF1770121.1 hypothetical protein GCK72_001939 [Caenorhabditis remanei]
MDDTLDYESIALKTNQFPKDVDRGDESGLEWYLRIEKEQSSTAGLQKMKFVWNFDWEELRNQYRVLGWRGTLMIYLWNKDRYIWTGPHEFDVQFFGTEFTIQKELERNMDQCYSTDGGFWFKHSFELEPIFQKRVALIVEGREIKINKKILIKNSTYFAELLNNEKTEIPIPTANYNDMKQLLGMFHTEPHVPRASCFSNVLQLAEEYKLPSVRMFLEFHLLINNDMSLNEKIEIADKYKMDQLFKQCIDSLTSIEDVKQLVENSNFTEGVKSKLFDRMMLFPK